MNNGDLQKLLSQYPREMRVFHSEYELDYHEGHIATKVELTEDDVDVYLVDGEPILHVGDL